MGRLGSQTTTAALGFPDTMDDVDCDIMFGVVDVIIGDTENDEPYGDGDGPSTDTADDIALTTPPPPPLVLTVVYVMSDDNDVGDACTSIGEITVMVVAGEHHQDHPTQQKAVSIGIKTQLKTHITKRKPKNPITIMKGGLGWFGCGGCSPDKNPLYKNDGGEGFFVGE